MSLVVLLGGARSGKSALAVRLAVDSGAPVTFVATAEARDGAMAERIACHRADRPSEWTTIEEPLELSTAISRVDDCETLVVDCLSLWVANLLEAGREPDDAAALAARRSGSTVAVTNEVGLGVVPVTELGRRYRDVLGRVNAEWVEASERAHFVVAGRTLELT